MSIYKQENGQTYLISGGGNILDIEQRLVALENAMNDKYNNTYSQIYINNQSQFEGSNVDNALWFKLLDYTHSQNSDILTTLLVEYNREIMNTNKGIGILNIGTRVATIGYRSDYVKFKWLVKDTPIGTGNFALVYDWNLSESGIANATISMYVKVYTKYTLYRVRILDSIDRNGKDKDINTYNIRDNISGGLSELPSGDNINIIYSE